jgi:anaerobic selenocysteine-containing dehydrogenase
MEYQKYSEKDDAGRFVGFKTSSKKVEIYSQVFRDHGYDPLPSWTDPFTDHLTDEYPLIFTGGKVSQFNHSQHRALPSLRRAVPHPFLEINPQKAKELDIKNDDWVTLETPYGGITLQAKLTKKVAYNVVSSQNGWWQGCPELNLPGYDPFSSAGANANLIHSTDEIDPISGSLPNKGYPCKVKKKEP